MLGWIEVVTSKYLPKTVLNKDSKEVPLIAVMVPKESFDPFRDVVEQITLFVGEPENVQ